MLPDLGAGLSIFAIGLAKKAWLADGLAPFVGTLGSLGAMQAPGFVTCFAAWGFGGRPIPANCISISPAKRHGRSALFYTVALACGLPMNFNSPYKARASALEFCAAGNMTLSRFLRDYLYIPLGGNRRGPVRRYANLMITMLLGGLWHGAAWTFVIQAWAAVRLYLMINHGWATLGRPSSHPFARLMASAMTFVAVVVGWVFFRSVGTATAWHMVRGMIGLNGATIPEPVFVHLGVLRSGLHALGVAANSNEGGWNFVSMWGWIPAFWPWPGWRRIRSRS